MLTVNLLLINATVDEYRSQLVWGKVFDYYWLYRGQYQVLIVGIVR
jgi:hypothetical protein